MARLWVLTGGGGSGVCGRHHRKGWARVGGPPCCGGVAVRLGGVSVRGWRRPRQSVVAAWPGGRWLTGLGAGGRSGATGVS